MTAPTVQVLLDNFTGAFPFDITAFLEEDPVTFSRGRPDEFASASAGTLSLTLDNTDGRFTLASATYGIGLGQQIRVKVNGVNFWTGFVQEWPVGWPGGGQSFSTVQVTAVDAFARLSRWRLRSAVEEDIRVDVPAATYPLSEDAGATLAGDKSGNGMPSLGIAGSGAALTFGSGTGPTDGLTCASFFGGTFLRNAIQTPIVPSGSAVTLECYFATSTVPSGTNAPMVVVDHAQGFTNGDIQFSISTAGKLVGGGIGLVSLTSAATVTDGLVHHAMLTVTAGGAQNLYLDGVNVGSGAGAAFTADLTQVSVAPTDMPLITGVYVGTVAHATVYTTALTAARAAVHADATNDHTGETPATRTARIAGYVGIGTGSLDTAGNTTLGPANQGGRDALTILNETADATLGFVLLNGTGQVATVNGYSVAQDSSPDSTIPADPWADEATVINCDMANVINEATGGSTASENVFTASNAFSVGRHGIYHQDFTWNVNTDAQVVDRTNYIVATYNGAGFFFNPTPRVSSLTFDVLSMDAPTTTQALALDVSSYLAFTNLPSQANIGGSSLDLIVQGLQWTISRDTFSVEVNCTKRQNYNAWILGDAFFGVLGSTTKLYGA